MLNTSKHVHFWIFRFRIFLTRYHNVNENKHVKKRGTFQQLDLYIPPIQNFQCFDVGHCEPDITDCVKNLWRKITPSQNWTLRHTGTGWAPASTSRARASMSKHEQARTIDFGHFEPDITDFVNKLYRKVTPSQNCISGTPNSQIPDFSMLSFSNQVSPILKSIYEAKCHFPKTAF